LIDEPTRLHVFRDFTVLPAEVMTRPSEYRPKRTEEAIPAYSLSGIKEEAATASGAPRAFSYTQRVLKVVGEAIQVARRAGQYVPGAMDGMGGAEQESLQRMLRSWNLILAGPIDYAAALDIHRRIRDAGLAPDATTYRHLILKSPDYAAALSWLQSMREAGIQPDLGSINVLIQHSPSFDEALSWARTLSEHHIQPDIVTYNALITKAPDYQTAKSYVDAMQERGIQPDGVTYKTLLSKRTMGTR
jgi:hypothetical protein